MCIIIFSSLSCFRSAEESSKKLIEELMDINKESRKREELLEVNEKLRYKLKV